MFLLLLVLLSCSQISICSNALSAAAVSYHHDQEDALPVMRPEDLSELALANFMRRTDSDVARYIRPHLVMVLREAASSPDMSEDDHSPEKVVRRWTASPDLIRQAPRQEIDEIIFRAIEKGFKEKEEVLKAKEEAIDSMFTKQHMVIANCVVGGIITIITALSSIFATKDSCK